MSLEEAFYFIETHSKEEITKLVKVYDLLKEKANSFSKLFRKKCKKCRGKCCTDNFFSTLDFVVFLYKSNGNEEIKKYTKQREKMGKCPYLTSKGCFLKWKERPLICLTHYCSFVLNSLNVEVGVFLNIARTSLEEVIDFDNLPLLDLIKEKLEKLEKL